MPDSRPTFVQSLSRLGNRIKTRGLTEVTQLAIERARAGISSSDTLLLFVRASGGDATSIEGLELSRGTAADALSYARDIGTDSATTFRSRLTERTHCYIVRDVSGLIVHASWVTTGSTWTRELRAYLRPPDGDAYVYESFTRPEVRGQGVYPFTLRSICAAAAERNIGRVWMATEADNVASIRAVTKAGFEEAFRLAYRRKLGTLHIDPPVGERADEAVTFVTRSP